MNNLDKFYESSSDFVQYSEKYFNYISQLLGSIDKKQIADFVQVLIDARNRGSSIYFIGNGGSASTASHYACDFSNPKMHLVKPFRTHSLTDNMAIITASGNDRGFDQIFVDQLGHILRSGDVVVAISASGNSANVVNAIDFANKTGAITVAVIGFTGGKLKEKARHVVFIPSEVGEYGPVEDIQLMIDHLIASYLHHKFKK